MVAMRRIIVLLTVLAFAAVGLVACKPPPPPVCGNAGAAPVLYTSVVVFSFENRTWSGVGGTQFQSMPYLNGLAKLCSTFSNYTEPDTSQNSATQYVGTLQGSTNNSVLNDCSPSASCQSTADNLYRQARAAGIGSHEYHEGASSACSVGSGNAVKHEPWFYYRGGTDQATCGSDVLPFTSFDPSNPPAGFSFITPTLCNDGHDCSNSTVDAWAQTHVQPVLNSAAYKAGHVAVFVWYDEDRPVPNMQLTPTATAGPHALAVTYGSSLAAWESMLGLACLANACTAPNMRTAANL